ncbi:MutS-related protein [Anaerosacchariphilus polymeriproducens]|uniref:DNA mismatch repair proteins mutS family domain-containing protein n=1 Tax=Anaerosacchariphilus polymeriproducens TaxID=1812858 RepID=A0A371ATS5_9FIRM|nr:hypothetical protein [Anaerosacchariphilus polymeriproducens]RDU22952.1 hypothetical protein DWV06_11295 [Anaerosacchariphilus polymeriproducens]
MDKIEILGIVVIIIGGYLLITIKLFWDLKKKEKKFLQTSDVEWGKIPSRNYDIKEFQVIKHYFLNSKKDGFFIDDITWNDLDMDRIFEIINLTYSSAGQEYLYDLLRRPVFDKQILEERHFLIEYFSKQKDVRKSIQLNCAKLGRTKKLSITDYLDNLLDFKKKSNFKYYITNLGIILGFAGLFFRPDMGIMFLVGAMVFSGYTHYIETSKIEPYIQSFQYIINLMNASKALTKDSNLQTVELRKYMDRLKEAQSHTKKFERNSFLIMTNNNLTGPGPETIILGYLKILTQADLIKFNSMINEVKKNIEWIYQLLDTIGLLESMIAVASFRKSLKYYSIPELSQEELHINAVQLYHPLIKEPVANDISVRKGMLITGSNASGKSTFLKTVALNQILVQTIMTSMAERYESNFFKIYSSMSLKDNLENKESYFMVEIKSLKRILDAKKEIPILCFVDEVLRGTNTIERIAASAQILKSLAADPKILCFAATHDIELTQLLEEYFENYHFEEKIVENDILFDYQLLKNKATTRNAIQLLKIMGYDDTIVSDAEETAELFLKSGKWKLNANGMEAQECS